MSEELEKKMNKELETRMEVVERLTKLFRTERMVYLVTTVIALLMLIGSALSLMVRDKVGIAELPLLFGSAGIISYSVGRLLFMWSEALKRLMPSANDGKDGS